MEKDNFPQRGEKNPEIIGKLNSQVKEFLQQIRKRFGANLVKIILFGSRARGDSDETSDYDFLLIFRKVTPEVKRDITDLEGDFLYKYSMIISAFCSSEDQIKQHRYEPFLMNIQKEGILV